MRIYTKKGDGGTTGLLFGGPRVSKADFEPTPTARPMRRYRRSAWHEPALALRIGEPLTELVLRLQRELFVVGAELATHLDRRPRLTPGTTRVTSEMVSALEHEIDAIEADHPMPEEFVLPESRWAVPRSTLPDDGPTRRAAAVASRPLVSSRTRRSCPT